MKRTPKKSVSILVEDDLKHQFAGFCPKRGLTPSRAVHKFVNACNIKAVLDNAELGRSPLDARLSFRVDEDQLSHFDDMCKARGVSVAKAIRAFMYYCVTTSSFPPQF